MALKMLTQPEPQIEPVTPHIVPVEAVQAMTETETLTQEYVTLYKKAVQYDLKSIVSRMETLRKFLMETANAQGEDAKPYVFTCPEGTVEFSERAKNTDILNPSMLVHDLTEKFDVNVAWSIVNIALTPLRQILSPNELKKYTKEIAGSRTVKAIKVT